nr:multidrug resistance-associated protein 6 [Tanacetum cinerariifolium]
MYEKAIKACALDKDIEAFKHGDLTEIGQRGLNMSEGQKQRIQLARSLYNDADIYLLDDPFSAVDAHTAATLFNLEKKTVILVTHQLEFLSSVDNILDHLLTAGTAFEWLVNAHKEVITGLEPSSSENKSELQKTENIHQSLEDINKSEGKQINGLPGVQLTEEEEKAVDTVEWKPFLDYVVISEGLWFSVFCVSSQDSFVALQAAASYWLCLISVSSILTYLLVRLCDCLIFIMASVTWQVLIGYYQPARELMRINGTTKAPVMNYVSENSLGVATIRAFKMQDRFFKEHLKLVDTDATNFLLVFLPKGFVPT